jgi:GT2 family glycosyltransferase
LAVAVLYKQAPTESNALCSFLRILEDNPQMAGHFSLLAYDNSPQSHEVSTGVLMDYVHDPSNGGLAGAYNHALAQAERGGCEWLLLLDQDTSLTEEFLSELIACANALQPDKEVAAIVPKLMVRGAILSPAQHFIDYIRYQFTRRTFTFRQEDVGVQPGRISAYNSGSTLRVSVLRSIGGFPKEFWLDYLDHAVFHALSASGYSVYVLRPVLKHELAESDLNTRPIWRFRNVLKAQALFVKHAGKLGDQLLYRLWLLRSSRRLRADCDDKRIWKETALQALRFWTRDSTSPVRPPTPDTRWPQ